MKRPYDYVVVRQYDEYDEKVVGKIDMEGFAEDYTQKQLKVMLLKWCIANDMGSGVYCIKIKGYDVECMYPEYFQKR